MTLFFDVLFDDFIGDVAATDTEIPSCPEVASPEFLSQVWKLVHQFVGTLPFQHLEQAADGQTRWHAHQQMNVVAGDVPFHNCDFRSAADFPDQFTQTCANFTTHHWFTILCHP